ncbi:hypothetical protein C2E21_8958 [Chlorella sorokiniana]|uniref:Rotatin n=1 Tax=Chlorella sorokiniana TaxID=3076 RepID=A0A2P6TD66_CHLSO|nr:hypothetical protein C2E21_8958 [Chlorella sorokiniana]|eukprot:PRW20587.1 hypothetical protein C2E21_8958 [Chlorella sorokiniana]
MASLPLIDKLAHPLPDVRRRALRSLQFKLQHGLLDAASLTGAHALDAAERLLSFLLHPLEPAGGSASGAGDALIALELLAVLARQPGAAAQLLQLGADQALIRMADDLPGCSQPASALLGELLCSAAADAAACPPPAALAGTAVSTDAAPLPASTPITQLAYSAGTQPEPSPWASPSSLPWAAMSPVGAAATSRPSTPWPAAAASALAAGSRHIRAVHLSEDDSQQLFEVALELQPERFEAAGEASLLATLATLRYGVLADMPAAGVAGEPALLQALLRLVDGAQGHPAAAAAALGVLQALAASLAAAEPAAEGEAGLPLAPLAHECLLRCAALLCNHSLQPQALAAAQGLLPLLQLPADAGTDSGGSGSGSGSGCLALAPVVVALTEALRLELLSECTAAGVAPPASWATGFHALVLGPSTLGILQLIRGLVQRRPRLLSPQVLPPLLCDVLVALASHPVSLLAVLASPSVQPDLAAAALGQLAQVAGDARFGVVLGQEPVLALLLRHAQDSSPCHHMQQPSLAGLVALTEQQPSAADWLLADADARCVPLLPLAFHPLPAVRQAIAQLLDTLLFDTAARQLHSLAAQLADGPDCSFSPCSSSKAQASTPEPFCASYWFARPTAILSPAAALHPCPPVSVFASEGQQRLWRARQLCPTAAAGGEGGSAGSLLQLLSGPSLAAAPAQWEADLVRSSLAMLRGLQPEGLVADGVRQLAAAESHQQCHAALRRLELLAAALPKGLGALAAAPWRDALDLLLSAAPLSPEDCALWGNMLPLLQRLLQASHPPAQQTAVLETQLLVRLAEQFAGGSALSCVEQASSEDRHAAALLPAVLLTRALLDAEGAVQLLGGGAALTRLLRQPATALGDDAPGDAATLAPGQATAATHAFRAAHAAAALLATLRHLAPAECWAEVSSAPGLLAAAASAFSWVASFGCRALPVLIDPAVAALQQSAQATLAPLADAIALLAQTSSPDQLGAACSCAPLPLAAAVATAASSPTVQPGQGAGPPVGAVMGTYLMEQWLEAAAAASGSEKGSVEQQQQQQVLDAALGGLLAFSASAKQVAVDAGLHSSLLDSFRALAASLGSGSARPASPLQPLPQPSAAAHRTAKLQQLREVRRSGAKQPAVALAFGSRVPVSAPAASKHGGSRNSSGEPPLLERLVAAALSGRSQPVAALSAFAASPDGARVLVHSSGIAARALRALQDQIAAKEWRRLLPTLQVLTELCSQPEGQRAVLACSAPSDTLLGVLLSLAEHSAPAATAAMLLLRQLAICPEAKAHFVSRRGALQTLLDAVKAAEEQPERAAAAAHALWALVHGGERVKVAVWRCEGWEQALSAALAACRQEERPVLRSGVEELQRLLAK